MVVEVPRVHDFGHARSKNAYADALGGDFSGVKEDARRRLGDAVAALLTRAQAAGAVRAELRPADVTALLVGVARAVENTDDAAARERVVGVVLAGLRPPVTD
jgi:hypothetical protein